MSYATARRISLPDTAKLVRQALKAAYPTVRFSVRCERYSLGCSIHVHWTDGPTRGQVQPLLNCFDSKSFDGMNDSTDHHTQHLDGEEVRYEADYVTGSRTESVAFLQEVAVRVARRAGVAVPTVEGIDSGHVPFQGIRVPSSRFADTEEDLSDEIHYVAHRTSALPKPRMTVYPTVTEVA